MGYTNVRDYAAGKSDWIEAGLPVEGGGHAIKGNVNTTTKPEGEAA